MEKTIEGDEYLEFLDEALERRRNIRVLLADLVPRLYFLTLAAILQAFPTNI